MTLPAQPVRSYRAEAAVGVTQLREHTDWTTTDMYFATEEEARAYLAAISSRWQTICQIRVVPCDCAPTHWYDPLSHRAYLIPKASA